MTSLPSARQAGQHARIALLWALFIAYGSLVPLEFRPRDDAWQRFLHTPWLQLGTGSRADWVANILLYLVLAYFVTGAVWTRRVGSALRSLVLALSLGACLALAVGIEYLQLFFPPRTVSLNDLVAEALGTALGGLLWFVSGQRIAALWAGFISGGTHSLRALLALYALGYLSLAFFPYDLLISPSELAIKLARTDSLSLGPGLACGSRFSCGVKLSVETLLALPLGLLLVLAHPRQRLRPLQGLVAGAALGLVIEAGQILLASGTSQAISILTRALGLAWGVVLATHPRQHWPTWPTALTRRLLMLLALPYLALAFALNGLLPLQLQADWAAAEKLDGLRLLPFYYHYYTTETAALRSLLFVAGSYAPLGIAAALAWPARPRAARWTATGLALALCLGLETLKLFSVGNRPDPTNLLIASASAAALHELARRVLAHLARSPRTPTATVSTPPLRLRPLLLGGILPMLALLLSVAVSVPASPPPRTSRDGASTHPPPHALPEPVLPGFRLEHPRLPHPSAHDIALLQSGNPEFVQQTLALARRKPEATDASLLAARLQPGSVDLARLHQHLLALQFHDRGHHQVKPLALAYDWLHAQWSPAQRDALRDKLAEGCAYVIGVIRREALSPYNVYLYNAPLQALMACSIALHGEHPQGAAFMAFTHELWKHRVLPVWRQIMGRQGGWHEGGEYLAIGIGQAIHSLPAMWRSATGEDLFRSEAGIRGFLDFLVYRTRPDGSQYRWGDGSNFLRPAPDAVPLALEFRHAAAYSLNPPRRSLMPTGWPWGPLSDNSLIVPDARAALPLSRLFDGLGMLVARSDWSEEATYVSFKAGDNYWSHSHLDQGAFTIYKGGALAIDSGWYGPSYGSAHHMNYAYQSVAHNLVTVTDPADTMPGPGFEAEPRSYANDGGQRRIGSGWGTEAAPLDREQWQQRQALYHTGRIVDHLQQDGLVVAVADLTPAYTNALSGHGRFADRTRRVERLWRVFGYDRDNDAIVVFDDVVATDPAFRKRWLLHSIDAPELEGDGFRLFIAAAPYAGRSGGQLQGRVLLPRAPLLNAIGGPGFAFFVDGRNHDENGKLQAPTAAAAPGQPEPGNWRIELMPAQEAREDQFLVVMLPTLAGQQARASVRRIEDQGRVGAEISGALRTTRWWYRPGTAGVEVEIVESGQRRTHALGAMAHGE